MSGRAVAAALLLAPVPALAGVGASVAGAARWDSETDYLGFFLEEAELRADAADGGGGLDFGLRLDVKVRPPDLDGPVGWSDLVEQAVAWTGQGELWRVTAGRALSPLGYESVDMAEVPFATHGILYDYGSPTTLTGVQAAVDPLDGLLACTAFASNGRDLDAPQDRLVAGARIDLGPAEGVGLGIAGLLDGPAAGDRLVWLSTDLEIERGALLLVGEGTLGKREGDASGTFKGAMLTSVLRRGRLGLSGRLEWFDDPDRVQIAEEDGPAHRLAASLALLLGGGPEGSHVALEYRHDRAVGTAEPSRHAVTALLVVTGDAGPALPGGGE